VGTGYGGAYAIKGAVVHSLLTTLYEAARAYDLDIVLVAATRQAFAAAQNTRLRMMSESEAREEAEPWASLAPELCETARRLARRAATGNLVLFLGTGVGRGAGLPTWQQLLTGLAREARMDDRERAALTRLNVLDQGRIIEDRLVRRGLSLGVAVREHIVTDHHALTHSLLAALPVSEVVTTNYDQLFEIASDAANKPVAVLPYQPVVGHARWLLKMHGCVAHPEDIVLTREDYLRYADRRAALAGIVQALLITRHMLFVGFSLTDDNFHRIVDDMCVRYAKSGSYPLLVKQIRGWIEPA